jgi:heme a synthase
MITAAHRRFAKFACGVLVYNILVILWGAYVRISFSGDGCGAHWPFCNGQVIPQNMGAAMAIEFTHRMMTSIDSVAVIAMSVWAFRTFPRPHLVRLFSVLSLVFLFVEALLGAGLVLLRYVARDQSAGRAWYLSAHLTNTMLLLAALTITAWAAYRNADGLRITNASRALIGALPIVVFVSITGAIAALGDTLFPASSLSAGMQQDFSSTSTLLLRLRMFHPVVAVLGAAYLIWVAIIVLKRDEAGHAYTAAGRVLGLTLFQLAVGAVNLSLLAPVWMQLIHLFMADAVWIAVLLLVLEATVVRTSRNVPVGAVSQHS